MNYSISVGVSPILNGLLIMVLLCNFLKVIFALSWHVHVISVIALNDISGIKYVII